MKIDEKRKTELEQLLGYQICPLTIEDTCFVIQNQGTHVGFGVFSRTPLKVYRCAVDNGIARGGMHEKIVPPAVAISPCSREYSHKCRIYGYKLMFGI